MGIFDKIKTAIWGDDNQSVDERPAADRFPSNTTLTTGLAPDLAAMTPAAVADPETERFAAAAGDSANSTAATVDVSAKLDAAAAASGQHLDWRHSIVDLMKALGMDASLEERRDLATELNYPGDRQDSAAMNSFLHKALLQKLADNGGNVPADLLD